MEKETHLSSDTVLSKSITVESHSMAESKFKEPLLKRPLDVILSTF